MAEDSQGQRSKDTNPLIGFLNSDLGLLIVSFIGRLGICYLFLTASLYHLTMGFDHTVADMTARGIPFPNILNVVAMATSSALALALLFNFKPRWASLGLAAYTFCVSMTMYTPGSAIPPEQKVYLMKDMALFGALLLLSCSLARNSRNA